MPIHVFRTEREPQVAAFANERGAMELLPRIDLWRQADGPGADGVTGLPELLQTAIDERRYILLYVGREVAYPAPAILLPFTRRANDD
jgi:hypothetical protein